MTDSTPATAAVRCIHCGKEGTHRVCDQCFKPTTTAACAFGDPTCPCRDGDVCHYVDDPLSETLAMTPAACCEVHKLGKCDAVFTCCDKCPTFFGRPAPLVPGSHECYGDRHDDCVWTRCECGCHCGRPTTTATKDAGHTDRLTATMLLTLAVLAVTLNFIWVLA